jgi:hypothetical protein
MGTDEVGVLRKVGWMGGCDGSEGVRVEWRWCDYIRGRRCGRGRGWLGGGAGL